MEVRLARLDEVAEVRLGRQRSPKNHVGTQMRSYIRAANVGWGGLLLDDVKTMNFTDAEMKVYRLKPGDLLLGEASGSAKEVGKPAIWSGEIEDCAFQNTLLRVRPRDAEPRYLLHFFKHEAESGNFASQSRGVGIHHLGKEALASWLVPLPPCHEQRRIADILDRAEGLRAKRRLALAQIDILAQCIFLDMFAEWLEVPSEISLNQIAQHTRGSFVNGPFGSDLLTSELQSEGVPVIYIRDIRRAEYVRVSKVCVTPEKATRLAVCSVRPGDVLVAKVGDPPGAAAIYPIDEPEAVVTQDVIRIRLSEAYANAAFVSAYLNSEHGKQAIAGITVEATRSRFSLGQFKDLRIPIPPLAVQNTFATRIAATEMMRTMLRASLAHLDTLFASLQHRAFRGEL